MSTIAPSRLKNVTDAELFMSLVQDNMGILAEEVAQRVATYQSGPPHHHRRAHVREPGPEQVLA